MRMFNPPHPGLVLQEFMGDREISSFADQIGIARTTLSRILNGHAGISAPMAVRLSEVLKTSPELWLGIQMQYDLWNALQARKAEKKALKATHTRTRTTSRPRTALPVGSIQMPGSRLRPAA